MLIPMLENTEHSAWWAPNEHVWFQLQQHLSGFISMLLDRTVPWVSVWPQHCEVQEKSRLETKLHSFRYNARR